ncbi:MAG TPA: class I adenylate-forming enzyme family protein [Stellaceae bacterium]|nr:class I adenylate-forming enzyme family protein [Stellaceae bacterium]
MTGRILTLLNAPTIAAYTAAGFWGEETIYHLAARQARAAPQAWAVRDRHRRLGYADLLAAADRLAAHFAGNGLRPGDRVALWLPSRVETAVALLACSRNGYVCCPSLHRDHRVGEVAALIDRMRAAAVIAEPLWGADADRRDLFTELAGHDYLRCAWRLGPPDAAPFAELPGPMLDHEASTDANQVMYLPFTSGTTGEPKGVLHSDNTLLATARAMARDWRLERAVLYTLSPLSHNLGLGALVTAFCGGGELVVHDLPRGQSLLGRLAETDAEFLFGVPTHAIDLLAELRTCGAAHAGTVRGFRISGAAAPAPVVAELMRYGIVPQSGYGMTEACSHQYTLPDDPPERITGSCGRACAGYEVRIFCQDDPDSEAAPGESGEIGGRGASLMLGYFDDQRATEAAFNAAGWYMTGDLGRLDESGYLHVAGRKKDVIIRGGRNIHPMRIEALALRHQAVEKAAAFAVADDRLGERVCLAVVTRGGAQIEPRAIIAHLAAAGLARYDMPEFLLCLDEMPLTASGKMQKRELTRQVTEGLLKPIPVRS